MRSVLIFDLVGPMAHFRKFDTNSSSLTYLFPPRSTVAGLIAGILGMERDTYYDIFHPDHCNIGLSVKSYPRKLMQTVNYMYVTSRTHLNNSQGHTQIPIEFLLPEGKNWHEPSSTHNRLRYRIYFQHIDQSIHAEIKERIIRSEYVYPPYLGLTEMLGQLEWVEEVTYGNWQEQTTNEVITIHSVCPIYALEERSIQLGDVRSSIFYKERMLRYFTSERNIGETVDYLYEKTGMIKAKPRVPVITLNYKGLRENIIFM